MPVSVYIGAIASFYTTVLEGLSVMVCDGVARKGLKGEVACPMAAWDLIVGD